MKLRTIIIQKFDDFDITALDEKDVDALDFTEACDVLCDLEKTYQERQKYNLEYAYVHAQMRINHFYDNFMVQFNDQKEVYKKSDSDHHHITIFVDRLYKHVKKLHVNYKKMNTAIFITSLVMYLGLILGVHWLTEHFVHQFAALIDSFIIVAVLAVVKIFFEERFLREKIEKRGWRIYKNSIDMTKSNFAKVILAYLLMKKANETGMLLKEIVGNHRKLLHALHNHVDFLKDDNPICEE